MTDRDYELKLDELDRLLNDPDSTMEPSKVWSLLAEISHRHLAEASKAAGLPNR
ncbi:MAG: peptide chain release factor 1 [Acetobacteraceae bacterium]